MRRTIILLSTVIAAILSVSINALAQDNEFGFQKNEDGDLFLTGTISYDCSPQTAWKRIQNYLVTLYKAENVKIDEENNTLVVNYVMENSKYILNPLAGEFRDDVVYDLTITNGDNCFTYTFSELSLNSSAKGFANYDKRDPMRTVLKKYNKAKERAEDPSLNKNERREATKEYNDLHTSLTKVVETLNNRITTIKENVE